MICNVTTPLMELVMSVQCFKDKVDPLACMFHTLYAMASSDLPLGDLSLTNMAAGPY